MHFPRQVDKVSLALPRPDDNEYVANGGALGRPFLQAHAQDITQHFHSVHLVGGALVNEAVHKVIT
jgi:hypothetical protein